MWIYYSFSVVLFDTKIGSIAIHQGSFDIFQGSFFSKIGICINAFNFSVFDVFYQNVVKRTTVCPNVVCVDREVKDYINDNALMQLMESERIKEQIRNIEIDLWNY